MPYWHKLDEKYDVIAIEKRGFFVKESLGPVMSQATSASKTSQKQA